jgi:DNA (cytosine-5)-methyltransferase 1
MTFTHLDCFAGIGGFSRAVHWLGGTTVGFVEWDAWNRRVLAKHWPEAHFHGDIKTFTAATLRDWGIRTNGDAGVSADVGMAHAKAGNGIPQPDRDTSKPGQQVRTWLDAGRRILGGEGARGIDLVTGGYPCQPFSLAGQRLGAEDDRHLWPEMRRVIDLCRPRFVLAENVAGHVSMGLDTVLAELEADGYTCGAVVVPACAVNALHRRDRVWIMAHAGSEAVQQRAGLCEGNEGGQRRRRSDDSGSKTLMADAEARGIRRGWAPGHDGQPAQRGEGVGDPDHAGRREHGRAVAIQPQQLAAQHAGGNGTGPEVARPVDLGPDGIFPGLVRRPATGPAEPDLIRQAWADGSWELDLPRVVADEPERRQKLQAAGNAIVPIVAYEILRVMIGEDAA